YGLVTSPSALVRRRVSVVALGTLAAFLTPAVLMAASAFYGGKVPLNAGAFTAFLFPVSLAYAIVKQDLFEIDVMLRRATTYAAVVVVIGSLYLALLSADAYFLPIPSPVAQSPLALAILNLALLFLIAPVRARVQDGVDRLFFRKAYDAEQALSELSHALVSVHTLGEVVARTHAVMATTMCPASAATFLWEARGQLLRAGEGDGGAVELTLPPALAERIERGEILARYEWDDGSGRAIPPVWHTLGAELLVPIRRGRAPMGALALGRKGSGRPYTMHDAAFLRAAASQIALAMTNAGAFARLESLNASLEQQVQERTASLAKANTDLGCSLTELRTAYQQLERNQASLMRAERLATLGRLTAGIAHEVNSPPGLRRGEPRHTPRGPGASRPGVDQPGDQRARRVRGRRHQRWAHRDPRPPRRRERRPHRARLGGRHPGRGAPEDLRRAVHHQGPHPGYRPRTFDRAPPDRAELRRDPHGRDRSRRRQLLRDHAARGAGAAVDCGRGLSPRAAGAARRRKPPGSGAMCVTSDRGLKRV